MKEKASGTYSLAVLTMLTISAAILAGCSRPAPPPPAAASPAAYIANRSSRIVHRGDCKCIDKMKSSNRVPFDHLSDALAEGFRPCHYCLPPPVTVAASMMIGSEPWRSMYGRGWG